ncbi:MAG: LCP family protein [Chloroflexi bacterium]|nr:LCP family protein [Chloroflexota bacterium]
MSGDSRPDDKTIAGWSRAETIAIRVRRWRQRSRLWWLVPAGFGLFGCALLAGAIAFGLVGKPPLSPRKPDPAVNTTITGGTAAAAATAQRAAPGQATPAPGKPLTLLLLGSDRRPGDGTVGRTDSLHLVSLDADGKGVGVLALPRDLYVNIPDSGRDRINVVFAEGSLKGDTGGGDLMRRTLADNFGLQIDHYIYIDFTVFVTVVDTIGGIDVNVPYTIDDPLYPDNEDGYDPFRLDAGLQHLDGATALKYVRTRHETNDFYRARRQQQVMLAIRDRVLRFDLLPVLVPQIPALWTKLADGYKTDLTPDQATGLVLRLKNIDESKIRTGVVDDQATLEYTTPEGANVLVPDTAKVTQLIKTILYPSNGN